MTGGANEKGGGVTDHDDSYPVACCAKNATEVAARNASRAQLVHILQKV